MSYVNQTILKSFASKNSFITSTPEPEGLSELILQVDDMIYQKLGIATPADPSAASPTLRNIACALVYWFATGMQADLEEQEYTRRKTLYDRAMDMLDSYHRGIEVLKDSAGTELVNNRPTPFFTSDDDPITKL